MILRTKRSYCLLTVVAVLALVAGSAPLHAQDEAEDDAKPRLNIGGVPGQGGVVKGIVKYTSQVQNTNRKINMSADATCGTLHPEGVPDQQHRVFGKNGDDNTLQNVFVFVSKGVDPKTAPKLDSKPMLDQVGCLYTPRVQGVVTGQTLEIHNSDNTQHNVNMSSVRNGKFNKQMPGRSKPITHEFAREEMASPRFQFKCDVHPWMSAFVHVLEHPYFAVTQEDGTFEIHGLPPGEYEVTTWHEYRAYQPDQPTYTVTVAEGKPAEVVISYASRSRGGAAAEE